MQWTLPWLRKVITELLDLHVLEVSHGGGGGTPATTVETATAFGLSSAVGTDTEYARQDHQHGSPTNPVTAHEAAADPHTGYLKESDPNWTDLTDGGATTLHTHAASGPAAVPVQAFIYDGGANIFFSRDLTSGVLDETQWTMSPGGVTPDSAEAGLSGIPNMVTLVKAGFTLDDLAAGADPFTSFVSYAGTDLLDGGATAVAAFSNYTALNMQLLSVMVGDSGSGGVQGLAPAPAAGDAADDAYLHASGAWLPITLAGDRGGTFYNPSGLSSAITLIVWRAPFACTVTNVRGYRVGGTGATVNARRNGTDDHLASALSLTSADTWIDGGTVQNTAYAVGDKMEIMLVSAAGSPTQVAVQVDYTRP